jgi:putative transposase
VRYLRSDWQWKEANKLVAENDVLVFETLSLSEMRARWGRKVTDYAFRSLLAKVSWLAAKHGRVFTKIDRYEPSSKRCSSCKHIQSLTLDVRQWKCAACGACHERDHNAAINILEAGRSLRREGAVRPDSQAAPATSAKSQAPASGVCQKAVALPIDAMIPSLERLFYI